MRRQLDEQLESGSPLDSAGDASLVDMVRRGDRDAFGLLVQRYEGRLLGVLLRFVPDYELARDLAQEAFLRAYEKLEQFDPSRRFGPWLFRIGVNLALDFNRRKKRRGWASLFSDAGGDRDPDPETADPRRERDLSQEVRRVLELLPEVDRSVLILRDFENFSTSEIAAVLNRKEATVRWKLAEARNRFAKIWKKRNGEGSRLAGDPNDGDETGSELREDGPSVVDDTERD